MNKAGLAAVPLGSPMRCGRERITKPRTVHERVFMVLFQAIPGRTLKIDRKRPGSFPEAL
jgi:hypothetical protein